MSNMMSALTKALEFVAVNVIKTTLFQPKKEKSKGEENEYTLELELQSK